MYILFVTTFAAKFYLKELGEAVWTKKLQITVFYEHTTQCTCKKECTPLPAKADLFEKTRPLHLRIFLA